MSLEYVVGLRAVACCCSATSGYALLEARDASEEAP